VHMGSILRSRKAALVFGCSALLGVAVLAQHAVAQSEAPSDKGDKSKQLTPESSLTRPRCSLTVLESPLTDAKCSLTQ